MEDKLTMNKTYMKLKQDYNTANDKIGQQKGALKEKTEAIGRLVSRRISSFSKNVSPSNFCVQLNSTGNEYKGTEGYKHENYIRFAKYIERENGTDRCFGERFKRNGKSSAHHHLIGSAETKEMTLKVTSEYMHSFFLHKLVSIVLYNKFSSLGILSFHQDMCHIQNLFQ